MPYGNIVPTSPTLNIQQDSQQVFSFSVRDASSNLIDVSTAHAFHFVVDNIVSNGSAPNVFDSATKMTGGNGFAAVTLAAADTAPIQPNTWRYTALVQQNSGDDFELIAQGSFVVKNAARWSGGP